MYLKDYSISMSEKLWQRPYVSLHKLVLNQKFSYSSEGNVKEKSDHFISKHVWKISGKLTTNNYVMIPANKWESLGLFGKIAYLQFKPAPSKNYIIHLDVLTSDMLVKRISISNIRKETKKTASDVMIPFQTSEWTTLALDLSKAMSIYHQATYKCLKSIKTCCSLSLRDVVVSDNVYGYDSCPLDLKIKNLTEDSWVWLTEKPSSKVHEDNTVSDMYKREITKKKNTQLKQRKPKSKISNSDSHPILQCKKIFGNVETGSGCIEWCNEGSCIVHSIRNIIILMNIETEQQHFFYTRNSKHVKELKINAEGTILAAATKGKKGTVELWNLKDKISMGCIEETKPIKTIAISDSGFTLCVITGEGQHTLALYEIPVILSINSKVNLALSQIISYSISKIQFVPNCDDCLVSCGKDNVRFWRKKQEKLKGSGFTSASVSLLEENFLDLAISDSKQTGDMLVYISTDNGMLLNISYSDQSLNFLLKLHDSAITSVCCREDLIITSGLDCKMRVWPEGFQDFYLETNHKESILNTILCNNTLKVAVLLESGSLGYLDIHTKKYFKLLDPLIDKIKDLETNLKNNEIITLNNKSLISFKDSLSFRCKDYVHVNSGIVTTFASSPSGENLVLGMEDGYVLVMDRETLELVYQFRSHGSSVDSVHFTPTGNAMLSASKDSIVFYQSGNMIQPNKSIKFRKTSESISISSSHDGSLVGYIGPIGNDIHIYCSKIFEESASFQLDIPDIIRKIEFSQHNTIFAITSDSRIIEIAIDTGTIIREQRKGYPEDRGFTCMCLTDGGQHVITGGYDGNLRVWHYRRVLNSSNGDSKSIKPYQKFSIQIDRPVVALLMVPGTGKLIAADDSTLYIYDLKEDDSPQLSKIMDNLIEARTTNQEDQDSLKLPSLSCSWSRNQDPSLILPVKHNQPSKLNRSENIRAFLPPEGEEVISLKHIIGYSAKYHQNLCWVPKNGKILYSCGKNIIYEDIRTNSQRIFSRYPFDVVCFSVHPNEDCFVCGYSSISKEEELPKVPILLWKDLSFNQEPIELEGHYFGIQVLSFCPSGELLLSIGDFRDQTIQIWDFNRRQRITLTTSREIIHSAAWNKGVCRNGKYEFATVGHNHISIWTLKETMSLEETRINIQNLGFDDSINITSVNFVGVDLWVGTEDGDLLLINSSNHELILKWTNFHDTEIGNILENDGEIITFGIGPHLRKFCYYQNPVTNTVEIHSKNEMNLDGHIISVSFHSDLNNGIVSTVNGSIWHICWSQQTATVIKSNHVSGIRFIDQQSSMIVTSSLDGSLIVWNRYNGTNFSPIHCFSDSKIYKTAILCNENILFVSENQGNIMKFKLNQTIPELLLTLSNPYLVTHMDLSNDGHRIFMGDLMGNITVIQVSSMEVIAEIRDCYGSNITDLRIDKMEKTKDLLAAAFSDGNIGIWQNDGRGSSHYYCISIFSPKIENEINQTKQLSHPTLVQFLPKDQEKTLICSGPMYDSNLIFYNFNSHLIAKTLPIGRTPLSMEVSMETNMVCISTEDGIVSLIDYSEGIFQDFVDHSDSVTCVTFDRFCPNKLITGSANGEIFIWNIMNNSTES
eukprot:gb/GECH01010281.1/.p1 GENE.gb/GECH01010281.1/~~gb/GECH01010281.1/.p1  ORF type:complete len:1579 (+),score=236.81 gb/GECH01010281.1/:1-4737(+)